MNISGYKSNRAQTRISILHEIMGDHPFENNSPESQSQFNIEGQIPLLISAYNSNNLAVMHDVLSGIKAYYTNINISHNFQIFYQDQNTLQVLLDLIPIKNPDEIRKLSFFIILSLITFDENILIKFIDLGLYKLCPDILTGTIYDITGYTIVFGVLRCIFTYDNSLIVKRFIDSPLRDSIVYSFIKISDEQLDDMQSQYITDCFCARSIYFDKFSSAELNAKYPPEKISPEIQNQLFLKGSLDDLIITLLANLFEFCGNPNDEITDRVLQSMVNLITTAHKTYLVSQIAECLSKLIIVSKSSRIKSVKIGLIQILNTFLGSYQYEIAWPYILRTNITILQSIQVCSTEEEKKDNFCLACLIFRSLTPSILFNLFNLSLEDRSQNIQQQDNGNHGTTTITYAQKLVSFITDCFSLFFSFNIQIIVENYDDKTDRNLVLTLEQFFQILTKLDLSNGEIPFDLKNKGIKFVFSALYYQVCFNAHFEVINMIIGQYMELIPVILEACQPDLKKMILLVLINIANKIQTCKEQNSNLNCDKCIALFRTSDIITSLDEVSKIDDPYLPELVGKLTSLIEQILS